MKFCNILTMGKNILILNNEVLQIKDIINISAFLFTRVNKHFFSS